VTIFLYRGIIADFAGWRLTINWENCSMFVLQDGVF